MTSPLSRRGALTGAATIGAAAPLLAACGDDGVTATDASTSSAPATTPSPASPTTPAGSDATAGSAAGGLVAAADVPVGGGVVVGSEEVVVTQPTAGEFKAFTAICTHQGCLVGSVSDNVITCPCHGSRFSAEDGSVISGQAGAPLAPVAVAVDGDQVTRA